VERKLHEPLPIGPEEAQSFYIRLQAGATSTIDLSVPTMKYQIVLQWPASSIADYDRMIELENALIDGLSESSEVDGLE
jgi:hypothetical protein